MKNIENEVVEKVENQVYKCPGCGANLKFDPESSSMTCEYCDYSLHIEGEESDKEIDFNAEQLPLWNDEAKMVKCKNCGAQNIIDTKTLSTICPFCGSSSAIVDDEIKGLKPNRVIPFKISANDSVDVYRNWLKKKLFAPKKLKKAIPNPNINGTYIPSWTYDTTTFTKYSGRLGKYYTVVVGSGKNRRTVTRIRWYSIRGVHQSAFDDILVCSSKKIDQNSLERLSPYNTNDSFEYDNRFLVGFSAEHYSMDVKSGFNRACTIADARIKQQILNKYHYDVVGNFSMKTTHDKITYKYVLLPLWICFFKYVNKQYEFKVNGENGKIIGKYPISIPKVVLSVLLSLLIIIAVLVLIGFVYGG